MIDSNATQAATRAGYAKISAKVSGHNCITNYNVKQELAKLQAKAAAEIGFTIERAQQMYLEDREFASKVNQAGARVTATTGICRLYGMDKDAGGNREQTIIVISPRKSVESEVIDG